MTWLDKLIQVAGKPDSIEILDIGDDERIAFIYESPRELYQWKAQRGRNHKDKLTERERQILALISQGLSYQEIGKQLAYSEQTIRHNASRIVKKLGAKNIRHAIHIAFAKKKRESIEPRDV